MKIPISSVLLLFMLCVHHSNQQDIDSNHVGIPMTNDGDSAYQNTASMPGNGLANVLRNRTNSLLQRLEGPRDRVLEFIKPAVKSDFSRNVTNVLNSIWNRVQDSNSSIIQNPLFRNSVVIPINTTLSRLKQITAADDDNSGTNLEIINLDKPQDEAHLREYLRPASSSDEAVSNTPVIFLFRDEEKPASASELKEFTEMPPVNPQNEKFQQELNAKNVVQSNAIVDKLTHNAIKSFEKLKRST